MYAYVRIRNMVRAIVCSLCGLKNRKVGRAFVRTGNTCGRNRLQILLQFVM